MNIKTIIKLFLSVILALLGLLWFLQGSDLVHMKPILCFANCEPITGGSLQWQIIGAAVFAIGVFFIYRSFKKIKQNKI